MSTTVSKKSQTETQQDPGDESTPTEKTESTGQVSWQEEVNKMTQGIIARLQNESNELAAEREKIEKEQTSLGERRLNIMSQQDAVAKQLAFYQLDPRDIAISPSPPVADSEIQSEPINTQTNQSVTINGLKLEDCCVIALYQIGAETTVNVIEQRVVALGYKTKADNFRPILSAALNKVKARSLAKSTAVGRSNEWILTAAGKKEAERLLKRSPAAVAATPSGHAEIDRLIIKYMQENPKDIKAIEAMAGIARLGYKPEDEANHTTNVRASFERLANDNLVTVAGKDDNQNLYRLTSAGLEEQVG